MGKHFSGESRPTYPLKTFPATMPFTPDLHYLNEITQLGETHEVVAAEDICNERGVKLLAQGHPINAKVFERIVKHKLAKPVDMCIRIADAIDSDHLAKRMEQVLTGSKNLLPTRLHRFQDSDMLLSSIHHHGLKLNTLLINKLTVMEKRRPNLFDHSLQVSATALTLGSLCRLSPVDQQRLATIGLLHDIGEMHLDPALFEPERKLSWDDWRQIHAHPIIAFLVLKQFPEFHPHISIPVLEHHERLDGSGYPRKLKSDEISKLGKIAAVAEIAVGILQKDSADHLEVVLKSLLGKLDVDAINALYHTAPPHPTPAYEPTADLSAARAALSELIESWDALGFDKGQAPSDFLAALSARMRDIKLMIYEAGNLTDPNVIAAIRHDPEASVEALSLMREALYQIGQAINQTYPRSDGIASIGPESAADAVRQWLAEAAVLLEQAQSSTTP